MLSALGPPDASVRNSWQRYASHTNSPEEDRVANEGIPDGQVAKLCFLIGMITAQVTSITPRSTDSLVGSIKLQRSARDEQATPKHLRQLLTSSDYTNLEDWRAALRQIKEEVREWGLP